MAVTTRDVAGYRRASVVVAGVEHTTVAFDFSWVKIKTGIVSWTTYIGPGS
jgi:hypothetical protein